MQLYYPRDIFGDRTGIWDDHSIAGWVGWDIYWSKVAGQRLNMGGSSAYIDHADAVGSTTMETDPAGSMQWDIVYFPWGQIWQQTGTRQSAVWGDLDWQVNDPLRPSATREYSGNVNRWMTPDPDNAGADVGDSQSWNMYSYAGDSPTTHVDPDGDYYCDPDYATTDENGVMTVHGGACHLEASDLLWMSNSNNLYPPGGTPQNMSPLGQEAPVMPTPGPNPTNIGPCVARAAAIGAVGGGIGGALLGGAGGTFALPGGGTIAGGAAGVEEGTLAGAATGAAVGGILCSEGGGGGGTGGGSGLSTSARKKLGNLASRAGERVRDVIRSRGGNASNVNQAGPWADKTLGETAEAAASGNPNAETAIKITKQAGRLGQQY
ncbi:MAG TPA: RHS repeat-associated core domain-containing protein, partial [Terriglobia bacterium]|nr:RHS repeat-associated core domain-containing protein [Terriglobia bacterium]